MAKGVSEKIVQRVCQYCDEQFETTQFRRKACPKCIPDGKGNNAALIRRLVKIKAVAYKGGKCQECGLETNSCVYDFHHLDPLEKDFSIGDKTSTVRWERVKSELDKCSMLCANCHRLEHSK